MATVDLHKQILVVAVLSSDTDTRLDFGLYCLVYCPSHLHRGVGQLDVAHSCCKQERKLSDSVWIQKLCPQTLLESHHDRHSRFIDFPAVRSVGLGMPDTGKQTASSILAFFHPLLV